jgi:hypothetical protein
VPASREASLNVLEIEFRVLADKDPDLPAVFFTKMAMRFEATLVLAN